MEALKKIVEAVEAHDIDISPWVKNFPKALRQFVLGTNYYWGLAAYIDLYQVKRVLEFGTCTGASAVVMCEAGATVDTYDVADKWSVGLPANLNRHVVEPEAIFDLPLDQYDMIFVDIDHTGNEEQMLHEKFVREYHGVVFYDDINLNDQMRAFWEAIQQDKAGCGWHATYGFGLVRY
jgi:hypothetical protein